MNALYWFVLIAIALVVLGLGGATVAGFLGGAGSGGYAWIFDLFSHFRTQYFLGQLLVVLLLFPFMASNRPRIKKFAAIIGVFNAIFLVINSGLLAPYYLSPPISREVASHFRVFHLNLWGGNNQKINLVTEAIETAKPDIISFQEFNRWWRQNLNSHPVMKDYPYRFQVSDDAVYSKYPFGKVYAERIPGSQHAADVAIIANMEVRGQSFTLLLSHPPIPTKPELYGRLKQHFKYWGDNRKNYGENFAIIGDLNSTPWSAPFRVLLEETRLRDSQLGFGVQPSFPAFNPPKRIPIDHVLVSPNFIVMNRWLGPDVGSDHLPVVVDLGLQRR